MQVPVNDNTTNYNLEMKLFNYSALLFATLIISGGATAQIKKKLDHTVYDSWNSISNVQQSSHGNLVTYEINPLLGDGVLHVERIDGSAKKSFDRGYKAQFLYNEKTILFLIQPEYDTIRKLKLAQVKDDKLPKDTLAIYHPATDSLQLIPVVESYKIAEKGEWFAYLSAKDEQPECPEKGKCKWHKKKKDCSRFQTSGTTLHIINPTTNKDMIVHGVKSYYFDKSGKHLIYNLSLKGKQDTLSTYLVDLNNLKTTTLLTHQYSIKQVKFDDSGKQALILHSNDTNKRKTYTLSYWNTESENANLLIDSTTLGMPIGYTVSEFANPYFSRDGTRIFCGTNKIVQQDPKDTLLASEMATLDVWSSFDLRLQPQQLLEQKRDERNSYLSIFHLKTQVFIQLEDETLKRITPVDHGNSDFALGFSDLPYLKSSNWDYPWKEDIYLINLLTGERLLVKSKHGYATSLAPSGKHLIWYEGADSSWYSQSFLSNTIVNLTNELDAQFASDVNGNPFIPFSEGSQGWTLIDGTEYFLVNSRYDVWALCPTNPYLSFSITHEKGKETNRFYRLNRFDSDSTYTELTADLIIGIDDKTKDETIYSLEKIASSQLETGQKGLFQMKEQLTSPHKFISIQKAEKEDQYIIRRMSFTDYPELEAVGVDFKDPKKLTETNPQQSEYNWGTVEMVEWTSFEGRSLRGLLYKPEDFDSTQSYPMITYYYEKYTENYHNYYSPKPTASIVYPTEYVSNGYLIFIPDIEYTPGHPAASAYDCIVSGTDYLTQQHTWIDSTRMGLQGQSWGGYQTAQLITMTDKYAAAMAGAPVSNMFSAYGGIRWGSGLSRMFQYERTQSRIGYTIWEKPELYIENSPLFHLDHVNTPLLIMHNDGDGAVPWYQGIELFMGLRRLDEPVWLLNYNGDGHNLMETANRKDLSIRMKQFFDYYLMDYPMPTWMSEGVPALDKGKNYGLAPKSE